MEELYLDAQRSVQKEIESWYARFAVNNQISLTDARKWLTAGQLEEFHWSVEQYIKIGEQAGLDAAWLKKLENASARFHISRLEAVQTGIQQQLELLYGNQVDSLDALLKKVVGNGYTHTAFEVQKGVGLGWDITGLDQKKLETLLSKPWTTDGRTFRDRCWLNKNDLVGSVSKSLTQGLLRGDSPAKITTAIQKQFGVHRYKAGRLVNTETTYFNAVATKECYKDLDVEMVEIIETLDSHTCSICGGLDGTVIPISQYEPGVTVPPFHPNCRGTTAPAIDPKYAGERAARNADGDVYYVPANMKYADWVQTFVNGGSKAGLTVATGAGVAKTLRDYNTEFGKKFGKDHYDQIRDRVDACQSPDLQAAWDKYETQIKVAKANHQGGAYCQGNSIYVNIDADGKGRSWSAPYATTFHESGHAIDGLAAQLGTPNAALDAVSGIVYTINVLPSQNGTLTYNGQAQSPSWNAYNPDALTLGGVTTGTNAGTYTATFTPKGQYKWADGTQTAKEVTWTINAATMTVPTQKNSLTYTGSAQSPTWNNYDSGKMTLGGTTSGTNAGSYNATFTPKTNYKWADGSTGAKTVAWSIAKAAGSLSLNKTSIKLTAAKTTDTITVTRAGNGTITATSSAPTVASVSVSGSVVTVTAKAKGNATITVSVAAGTNHTAPANKTCSVEVTLPTKVLNDNSWATIREVSSAGLGANYWAVGDVKEIKINGKVGNTTFSNLAVNAFILGFNHNSAREGGNKIHFQIGKIGSAAVALCDSKYNTNISGTGYFSWNTSNTNSGGWNACYKRKTLYGNDGTPTSPLANSLMAALPSDLRAVMQPVTKYTDNTGNSSNSSGNVTTTTDYLFDLSEFEVFGTRSYANQYEQNYQLQYDYYKAGNTKIANNHTAVTMAVWWGLRSPYYGATNVNVAYYSGGLRPGFAA